MLIKAVTTIPTQGHPMSVTTAWGTDGDRSVQVEFAGGDEPESVGYGPAEGQEGDWQSRIRFEVVGTVYYLDPPIDVDDPTQTGLQATFEKMLRDSYA